MAWDFFIFAFHPLEAADRLRIYFEEEKLALDTSLHLDSLNNLVEIEDKLWKEKNIGVEELYEKLGFREILYFRTRPLNDAICEIMMEYLEAHHETIPVIDGSVMLSQKESLELTSELYAIALSIENGTYEDSAYILNKDEREILAMYILEFKRIRDLILINSTDKFLWQHSF